MAVDRNPYWQTKRVEIPLLSSERIANDIAAWEAKGNKVELLEPGAVSQFSQEERKANGKAGRKKPNRLQHIAAAATAQAEPTVSLETIQEEELDGSE